MTTERSELTAAQLSEVDDLVALSGLQHLVFCERQAALIHVERIWREDVSTAEGRILHERVDLPGAENRRGCASCARSRFAPIGSGCPVAPTR